jgi:anti-sigma factor RsiW
VTSAASGSRFREHYDDLLPAYVNGTLTRAERRQVAIHLLHCTPCRVRRDAWSAISAASKAAFEQTPGPERDSHAVVQAVLRRIHHPAPGSNQGPTPAPGTKASRRLPTST